MSGKGGFFASRKYKLFVKYLSGFGASVVIVGALFKIMHWPGCDAMLIIGLLTEAGIFAFIALEPMHDELDWTRVFPELGVNENDESNRLLPILKKSSGGSTAGEIADKLDKAGIDDALLAKLKDSMSNLADNARSLGAVSTAVGATDAYVQNLENASAGLNKLTEQYAQSANAIAGITADGGGNFGSEMQKLGQNLAALNNVYELQLNSSQEYLNSLSNMNSLQESINNIMTDLASTAKDTQAYRENMAMLSQNLTDLNNVYGNMLKAMRG
ncbi:MAG: gliding motility protein GldL [Bacteroidetes bacterium]|nr:gliding motility protein GldL [Bacteroidota bacterium]